MPAKLRRRKGTVSEKLEGGCAKCCGKYCRMTPMTQALCCTVVVLGITGSVVWLGGSVLGAGNGASACGSQSSPAQGTERDDKYSASLDIFLTNTGIVVMMMLISSCICCVGYVGLCCGDLPTYARIIGVVCLIVAAVGALLYSGWIVYGTFALSKQPDCINALVYLALMYFYMIVFIGACVVGIIWKVYDTMSGGKQSFRVNLPT